MKNLKLNLFLFLALIQKGIEDNLGQFSQMKATQKETAHESQHQTNTGHQRPVKVKGHQRPVI